MAEEMERWLIGAYRTGGGAATRSDMTAAFNRLGWPNADAIEAEDAESGIWLAPLPGGVAHELQTKGYIEYSATVDGDTITITAEMP